MDALVWSGLQIRNFSRKKIRFRFVSQFFLSIIWSPGLVKSEILEEIFANLNLGNKARFLSPRGFPVLLQKFHFSHLIPMIELSVVKTSIDSLIGRGLSRWVAVVAQ